MPRPADIIILARDNFRMTRLCVESVRRHTRRPYNLILVDNGSSAPTARYLERVSRLPRVRLIRNERNLRYATAMNTAIMKGRAPYQAWLNNDVLVGPEWLERLIAAVESDPAAGAAGPCTNDPDCGCGRGARYSPGPRELPGFAAAWAVRFDGQREEVPLLAGFCFLVKRDAVARVGLLDERFFWGEEDDDYSLRLRLAGYRLLLALDVFVSHRGHCTGEKRRSRQRLHDGENIRLLRRKWVQGLERIRPSPLKRHPRASGPSSRPGSRGSQGNIRAACPRAG